MHHVSKYLGRTDIQELLLLQYIAQYRGNTDGVLQLMQGPVPKHLPGRKVTQGDDHQQGGSAGEQAAASNAST